jgi:putative transposase
MPSYPRYLIIFDGSTFHLTWQCHNQAWLMKEEWAKRFYYGQLLRWKDYYGVSIHSYNFMDNHPHLVGRTNRKEGISHLMRRINCNFAKEYNRKNKRKGQVVMDRFKSPAIQTDEHMLNVMLYIDLNPCRAKKVRHPREYRWTSYHYYAYGRKDPLITPAPSYLGLADEEGIRQEIYRGMVDALLEEGMRKKDYSVVKFIGDPNWVKDSYDSLHVWRREKYIKWKDESKFDYHDNSAFL